MLVEEFPSAPVVSPGEVWDEYELQKVIHSIIQLAAELIMHPLHDYQLEFAYRFVESVLINDAEELTLIQARQSGKTEVVAACLASMMILLPRLALVPKFEKLLAMFKTGLMVGLFAPTDDQSDTIFQRVKKALETSAAEEVLEDVEIDDKLAKDGVKTVTLAKCHSFCRSQTAHPKASIESKSYHIVVIDEAQDANEGKVRKCVAEGTMVWTDTGPVPVERVVREKLDVLTYDKKWDLVVRHGPGNGRDRDIGNITSETPSEWHENGAQPVWRVKTNSGRFVDATANHRWIARVRRGNAMPFEATTEALTVGMQVPVPTDAYWNGWRGTHDEGYLAGQIIGDGCTSDGRVHWCGHHDGALERVVAIAESMGSRWSVYKNNPENGLVEGCFVGGQVTTFLRQENLLYRKGKDKKLYKDGYSADFYRGYIEGLIDSDGCVGTRTGSKRVEIGTISEELARQAQAILQSLGVLSSIFYRADNGGFSSELDASFLWIVTIKGVDELRRLREVATLGATYKDTRLTELVQDSVVVIGRSYVHHPRGQFGKNISWERITSIEYIGEKPTYCVTVDTSNTVIWNGIVGLNSIHPMLAYYAGTILKIGSASRTMGDFYRAIKDNKKAQRVRGAKQNHFEYDWKRCAASNPQYAKFIEKEKGRLGEDSDEFLLSYCCKWLLDRGMYITEELFEALSDKRMQIVERYHSSPLVAGLDVARKKDSTVLTILWVDWDHPDPRTGLLDCRVLNWLEVPGDPGGKWHHRYNLICEFLDNYSVTMLAVDGQGMGDVVAEDLQAMLPNIDVRCMPSNTPDQSLRWKHLRSLMQHGMIGWPGHSIARRSKKVQRFQTQMVELEIDYRGDGHKYLVAAAPDLADKHDDFPDSLALAAWMPKEEYMPTVEVVSENPFFARRGKVRR